MKKTNLGGHDGKATGDRSQLLDLSKEWSKHVSREQRHFAKWPRSKRLRRLDAHAALSGDGVAATSRPVKPKN